MKLFVSEILKRSRFAILLFLTSIVNFAVLYAEYDELPGGNEKWQLIWNDEFDYPDINLDADWNSANGYQAGILCSRWRKNAVVSNGTLKLKNIKETLAGQDWTSASIWTKRQFQYGYFECRYRYAAATGTNNSFWLMSSIRNPAVGKQFELDINEGHYPNELNTNLHNWTDVQTVDGVTTHPSFSQSFTFSDATPIYSIVLETPVFTNKIRLLSKHPKHFHIPEFRVYNVNAKGYPDVLSPTADTDIEGLQNYARETSTIITSSGNYSASYPASAAADGSINRHWVSQTAGDKWIQFEFNGNKTIGCIQFINGWLSGGKWLDLLNDFQIQYFTGSNWMNLKTYDVLDNFDFSRDFHTYGVEWNEKELIYYFDRKEIRRIPNDICFSPASVYLSEAIVEWAGAVTDAIDGTKMEVDYVRVYDTIPANTVRNYIFNGGFENPTSTYDWKYMKEPGSLSSYSLMKTDPLEGLISLRINSKSSTNPYGTYLTQRVAVEDGKYELKFYARTTNTLPDNSKFQFKIINDITGSSILINDSQTDKLVYPDTQWKKFKYILDLKEDYSGKLVFGFGTSGTFDIDSVALVRIGDIASFTPKTMDETTDNIKVLGNKIQIKADGKKSVDIFKADGIAVYSNQLTDGINEIIVPYNGVYLVRIKENNRIFTKKILIHNR